VFAQNRTSEEVLRNPLEYDERIRKVIENLRKKGISVVLTEVGINRETGMMTKKEVFEEVYGPHFKELRNQIRIAYERKDNLSEIGGSLFPTSNSYA